MPSYQHTLIAVDFSPSCEYVVGRGLHNAKLHNSRVSLIHVVEYLPPMDFGYEPIIVPDWYNNEQEIVSQAEKSLHKLASQHDIATEHTHVLTGTPKNEILTYAESENVDLIVIGSHGRHGIQRLLGSTAYPVIHNSTCDVLAVRIPENQH